MLTEVFEALLSRLLTNYQQLRVVECNLARKLLKEDEDESFRMMTLKIRSWTIAQIRGFVLFVSVLAVTSNSIRGGTWRKIPRYVEAVV
jgi:hypothetical protein